MFEPFTTSTTTVLSPLETPSRDESVGDEILNQPVALVLYVEINTSSSSSKKYTLREI